MQQKLSIIIPIYNEEGNIKPFVESTLTALRGYTYEIILIDDGSTDGSAKEALDLSALNAQIRVLKLKRNFGQTAALAAGIDHATGDILIPMDGDGQNDPSDIPQLLNQADNYDVVSGWRRQRQDSFFYRKFPSWVANFIISSITGVHLHDYGCTLKAYHASILKDVQLSGEMHRFLPAWCVWQGGKVTEIPVTHHPRTRGKSKYGLFRTVKVLIDLFTLKFFSGYLLKPNYLFSGTGFCCFGLSLLAAGFAFYDKFGADRFPQYRIPLLLLSVFLALSALFLVLMGLLSEILSRMYLAVREQKPYRLFNE